MADNTGDNVYTKIGARPVINAGGSITVWGGSNPSGPVREAMDEAQMGFVEMKELLEMSGKHIAEILGVEAAYVTAGCYAALVLATAACMTGKDPEKRDRIPDTTGMKNEVILQKKQRYGYDRSYTIPGARLVIVGDDDGCTPEELEDAIGPNTAVVAYLIRPDWGDSVVSLETAVEIAHRHNVPVIADGASQIYPLDFFRRNAQSADLVCFGGKYFQAPHSTGFLCGKKELVEAAIDHGFIGPRPFGRGMKVDRQEIMGCVAAFDSWISMDHEERIAGYRAKYSVIEQRLEGIPTVREMKAVENDSFWALGLHIVLDSEVLGKDAQQVIDELLEGSPRIRASSQGKDTLVINAHNLNEGEEHAIVDRLRVVLSG